ncbi:SurA N-terminal domain-containing protein [Natranaerobius thermophilus]|uniref:SurA domain n=1 Tax=Natranaerobius thermophilus (strain ATCC BAA-1301 / DSM 18059 / JW/NM-WN-LF) TaxID=457570 RepID=B2A721_NATTJ|nr:SurA N-terminal domain-containing protein [Natranaerobius thermophilus]ACB85612.1 SurA domain [Natranaerobius thermophilus JW/NM-WN-LF]
MSIKKVVLIALSALLLFVLTACGNDDEVVAIVNDQELKEEDLDRFKQQLIQMRQLYGMPVDEEDEEQMDELQKEAVEEMVTETVLLQKAEEEGITVDEELVENELEAIENQFESDEQMEEALDMYGLTSEDLESEIRNSYMIEELITGLVDEDDISQDDIEISEEELRERYEHEKSRATQNGEDEEDFPEFEDRKEELEQQLIDEAKQDKMQDEIINKIDELKEESEIEIKI